MDGLYTGKIYNFYISYFLFFSSVLEKNQKFNILYNINKLYYSSFNNNNTVIDAIIGDLLGDGHIRFTKKHVINNNQNISKANARMEFTFSTANLPYLRYLKYIAYQEYCTTSEPTP